MSGIQTRITRHIHKPENMIIQGDNQSIETNSQVREIMEGAVKDMKTAYT